MPHEEAKNWSQGNAKASFYRENLQEAQDKGEKYKQLKKVIRPKEMPWEDSPQGRIKHLANEKMGLRLNTVDAFIQEIPAGSRSGKHRHMADEVVYILEGKGYDLHWDVEPEIGDVYDWKVQEEPTKWEWEEGDCVYIPVNTVHQHFNSDPQKPARFISGMNRVYKYVGFDDLEQIEDAPGFTKK